MLKPTGQCTHNTRLTRFGVQGMLTCSSRVFTLASPQPKGHVNNTALTRPDLGKKISSEGTKMTVKSSAWWQACRDVQTDNVCTGDALRTLSASCCCSRKRYEDNLSGYIA